MWGTFYVFRYRGFFSIWIDSILDRSKYIPILKTPFAYNYEEIIYNTSPISSLEQDRKKS